MKVNTFSNDDEDFEIDEASELEDGRHLYQIVCLLFGNPHQM